MEKRNRNVMILSIVALVLVLVGVTYAYFSAQITGIESASTILMTAGRMGIVYSEGDENISVSNIYPREEAWITKTFTLTGYNTTTQEMDYEVGIQIENNTFKAGQLTYSLKLISSDSGTPMEDVTLKSIVGENRTQRIGYGSFTNADGDKQTYELNIYFKENGKNQNFNQGAIFNGKLVVTERGTMVAYNPCTYNGELIQGAEYINGQYTYRYMQQRTSSDWENIEEDGWGVILTDKDSTDPVVTKLCTNINEKPVVSMSRMFQGSKATSLDLSSFDTSNVINMHLMFYKTINIDLSSFDTSNVTDMRAMFWKSQATTLDLSSFDTSKVTNMAATFRTIQATRLDLSNFDTSNVTDMTRLFQGSVNLKTIYGSNKFVTNNLESDSSDNGGKGSYQMFKDCTSLVGGAGTTYDANHVNREYAHIDGGTSNPGYFTAK